MPAERSRRRRRGARATMTRPSSSAPTEMVLVPARSHSAQLEQVEVGAAERRSASGPGPRGDRRPRGAGEVARAASASVLLVGRLGRHRRGRIGSRAACAPSSIAILESPLPAALPGRNRHGAVLLRDLLRPRRERRGRRPDRGRRRRIAPAAVADAAAGRRCEAAGFRSGFWGTVAIPAPRGGRDRRARRLRAARRAARSSTSSSGACRSRRRGAGRRRPGPG